MQEARVRSLIQEDPTATKPKAHFSKIKFPKLAFCHSFYIYVKNYFPSPPPFMPSGPPHPVSFTSIITSVDKPCPTSCHSRRYLSCPALSKAAIFHLRATLPLSSDLCSLNRVINKVINIKQHLRSLDAPSPSQATKATHDSWSPSWSFPGTDF